MYNYKNVFYMRKAIRTFSVNTFNEITTVRCIIENMLQHRNYNIFD